MNDERRVVATLEETKKLAQKLAENAKLGDCYCLIGDLGAGKTEFARSFIRAIMGENVKVTSPTFNILQIYEAPKPPLAPPKRRGIAVENLPPLRGDVRGVSVYHFDLYRIKHAEELIEIGLEEALEKSICLIEWPQVAGDLLPETRVEIHIEILDENRRKILITRHPALVAGSIADDEACKWTPQQVRGDDTGVRGDDSKVRNDDTEGIE